MANEKYYKLHWENRYIKLSISTKTIITFFVILTIPVLGIYLANTSLVRNYMTTSYIRSIKGEVPVIMDVVNQEPHDLGFVFNFISSHQMFRSWVSGGVFSQVDYTMAESTKTTPNIDALLLTDADGKVLGTAFGKSGEHLELAPLIRKAVSIKQMIQTTEVIRYESLRPYVTKGEYKASDYVLSEVVIKPIFIDDKTYLMIGFFILNNNNTVPNTVHRLLAYDTAFFMAADQRVSIISTATTPNNIWQVNNIMPMSMQEKLEDGAFQGFMDLQGDQIAYVGVPLKNIDNDTVGAFVIAHDMKEIQNVLSQFRSTALGFTLVAIALTFGIGFIVHRDTSRPLGVLKKGMQDVASGTLNVRLDVRTYDDFEDLAEYFNTMVSTIEVNTERIQRYNRLNEIIVTTLDTERVLHLALENLLENSGSQMGVVYLYDQLSQDLKPSVGINTNIDLLKPVTLGQGLVGRAAENRKHYNISGLSPENFVVSAGLADAAPEDVSAFPIVYKTSLIGVLCLGGSKPLSDIEQELITSMMSQLAIVVDNTINHSKVEELSIKDELTGTYNRRFIMDQLAKELQRAERYHYPVTIALLDLDHFKRVNDTYGHVMGDSVLKAFSLLVREHIRTADIFGRYGGEEFILIMPHTILSSAAEVIERLRVKVEEQVKLHTGVVMTVSIGVATYPEHGAGLDDLVKNADLALYQAKETGRNKVVIYSPVAGA